MADGSTYMWYMCNLYLHIYTTYVRHLNSSERSKKIIVRAAATPTTRSVQKNADLDENYSRTRTRASSNTYTYARTHAHTSRHTHRHTHTRARARIHMERHYRRQSYHYTPIGEVRTLFTSQPAGHRQPPPLRYTRESAPFHVRIRRSLVRRVGSPPPPGHTFLRAAALRTQLAARYFDCVRLNFLPYLLSIILVFSIMYLLFY